MKRKVIADSHAFHLARSDWVTVDAREGMELRVQRGLAWLTTGSDSRDIVLAAGESFRFERNGRALVEVLADAEIVVQAPAQPARLRSTRSGGLRAALALLRGAAHASHARDTRVTTSIL